MEKYSEVTRYESEVLISQVVCVMLSIFLICAFVVFHQVKNAMLAGAKGIILFSDPADYCAPGVHVCVCLCI